MAAQIAVEQSMRNFQLNRATEHLLGLAGGMLADGELNDQEILCLQVWLKEHREVAESWPGSAVGSAVAQILADGVVSQDERDYLVAVLRSLGTASFADTGAAQSEVIALPIEDAVSIDLRNAGVCHTGGFLFGTRAAVERATLRAGGMPVDSVTKNTAVLVIGSRVSPSWKHQSYGAKIEKAMSLQSAGHEIEIISEKRWIQAIATL